MLVIRTAEWLLDGAFSALKSGAVMESRRTECRGALEECGRGGKGGGLSGLNSWLPSLVVFLFACSNGKWGWISRFSTRLHFTFTGVGRDSYRIHVT